MKFGRRNRESLDEPLVPVPEVSPEPVPAPLFGAPRSTRRTSRRILRDLGLLLLIFVVGFSIAFIWLSPGPLLASDHSTPDVIGMPGDQAEVQLTKAGFKTKRAESRQHPTYEQGTVIWQDPAAGTILPEGTPVTLTVSDGIAPYAVPDVARLPLALAAKVIEASGFRMSKVDTARSAGPPGIVVEVRPAIGSVQPAGTSIQLVIRSSRPAQPANGEIHP
jgi:beta-lactam-binding protein with PASTA domain